jgi:lipopolysaccharide/colanic/teichoic acid biosynthesis glycosyltransferase
MIATYLLLKRLLDIVIASTALRCSPLLLPIALLIKRIPALFIQARRWDEPTRTDHFPSTF